MAQFAEATRPFEVWRHWQTLADGLHAQRVALSAADWTARVAGDQVIAVGGPRQARSLVHVPPSPPPGARSAIRNAGLDIYVDVPLSMSSSATRLPADGSLVELAADLADELLGALPLSKSTAEVVTATTSYAAWWVGFFLIVRDTGVHHVRLTPDLEPVAWADVRLACRVVGVGLALRALREHLWTAPPDASSTRVVYARATALAVQMESGMATLLDRLAELRVVDLVTTSMPWRGQFVKYAGGTGAGQVE